MSGFITDQLDSKLGFYSQNLEELWVEREVGGGIGMGNTCKPMADSFQCMTRFTTNKKK